jgi:hypothetical protein
MPEMKDRVITFSSVFLNGKCVFVEFIDLIKAPYLNLLVSLQGSKSTYMFDFSKIKDLSIEELILWYRDRKYQNLLENFVREEYIDDIPVSEVDKLMDAQLAESELLLSDAPRLNLADSLSILFARDNILGNKLVVWYPYKNPVVENDIKNTFKPISKYLEVVTGPIDEALKEIPEDSTYFFSDVTNIGVLEDLGKLDYSSIIIPEEYRYNKTEDGDDLINFDVLQKEHVFKVDKFYALTLISQ